MWKLPYFSKLFTLLSLFSTLKSSNCSIIRTSYGSIEGSEVLADGNVYHVFKKLPFAEPPIGKLRFQKPEHVQKWDGVLDGKEYGPACLSNSTISKSPQKHIDEDCLHANIFTSEKCLNSKNCPVVFYIHGGGMEYDSAVMFNDTFLLKTFVSRDIVLVISAFRLGIFSHFIVEDQTVAPTNIGAYDILLALEFVNSEIHNFGGDNKKVTLFGHSYGGATASAFTFSKKIDPEKRLFQQAVAMSPAREFHHLDVGIQSTITFAERAGCMPPNAKFLSRGKEQYMLECLQNMDQFALLRIQRQMEEEGLPEFEYMTQREPLFEEGKYSSFFNNPKNIPFMTGCTLKEMNSSNEAKPIGEIFDYPNQKEVDQKYRLDKKSGKLDWDLTDEGLLIKMDVRVRADALAAIGAPIYIYEYNYPKHSYHTDDLSYIMGVHLFEMDENEKHLAQVYPKLFTDFVKFGKPSKDWDVFNSTVANYYDVNWNETTGLKPQMRNNLEPELYNYWFVEMKEFDQNVTRAKKLEVCKKNRKLCTLSKLHMKSLPETLPFSDKAQSYESYGWTTYFIVIILFFVMGIFIGRFFCNRKSRDLYIQLDGNDYHSCDNSRIIERGVKAIY